MTGERRPVNPCHSNSDGSTTCTSIPRDRASVFSPDGRYLFVASNRSDVELWNVETRCLQAHFEGHTGNWVEDVVISPDGRRLATFEKGWNEVYVWDIDTQQLLWQEESGIGRIADMVFSPDSQHLYVASRTGTLSWRGQGPWEGWDDTLSPNGQTFVSVSRYFIKTWDVPSQKMRTLVSAESRLFREFAISPDGQKIAIGRDPWIEVRNLRTGAVEHRFRYNYGYSDIAFSSTGRWVTARGYKSIFLFDLENPEKLQRPMTEDGPEIDISSRFTFSENDEYLAATSRTNTNNVWQYWVMLWKRDSDTFTFQYAWKVPELSSHSRLDFTSDADGSPVLAAPRE